MSYDEYMGFLCFDFIPFVIRDIGDLRIKYLLSRPWPMKYYEIHKLLVALYDTYGDIKLSDITLIYKNVKERRDLGLL
jgi:hypothetical protein